MVSAKSVKKRTLAFNERNLRIGETHQRARLTDADIELVHALAEAGLSYAAIASKFDDIPGGPIGKTTIHDIVKGHTRAQTPTTWRFKQ